MHHLLVFLISVNTYNSGDTTETKQISFKPFKSHSTPKRGAPVALHDPNKPNSLVLYRPCETELGTKCHVVLDHRLTTFLRPHQREGVSFIYDCISGKNGHSGCILADEM